MKNCGRQTRNSRRTSQEQKALSNQSTVANFWPQNLNYNPGHDEGEKKVGGLPTAKTRNEKEKCQEVGKQNGENSATKTKKKNSQLADTNEKSNKYSIERKAFKATACQRAAATNGPCHIGLSPTIDACQWVKGGTVGLSIHLSGVCI